jgi:tRNA(Ile)-lysidine synthase
MPTAEQTERFRRDLSALAGGPPKRLGVAVSGGPDSLALLLLAHSAFEGRIETATVDHRLRPESADEAALVARICRDLGVPHAILADPAVPIAGASAQAQARALRYRLLGGWAGERGIALLATAHHADDQAETVLMRLARGAGLGGLSGIRSRRDEGEVTVLRPLLGWRRRELAAVVAEAGLAAADDPSNRSDAYDRTRFRALLAGSDLLPAARLAAAAAHLGKAEEALAWAAEREWQARARAEEGCILLDPGGLPAELLRRVSARAIEAVRGDRGDWRRDKLAAILAEVAAGGRATLAGVQLTGGPVWRFEREPPRRAG